MKINGPVTAKQVRLRRQRDAELKRMAEPRQMTPFYVVGQREPAAWVETQPTTAADVAGTMAHSLRLFGTSTEEAIEVLREAMGLWRDTAARLASR